MFLLDANILVYLAQGLPVVVSRARKWAEKGKLAFSVIAIAEFLAGTTDSERKKLEILLEEFGALPVDLAIARKAAEYRREFLGKKKEVFLLDCFLAATAKIYSLTLVTHNTSDFPMKDIKILDPLT